MLQQRSDLRNNQLQLNSLQGSWKSVNSMKKSTWCVYVLLKMKIKCSGHCRDKPGMEQAAPFPSIISQQTSMRFHQSLEPRAKANPVGKFRPALVPNDILVAVLKAGESGGRNDKTYFTLCLHVLATCHCSACC